MTRIIRSATALMALLAFTAPAVAQQHAEAGTAASAPPATTTATTDAEAQAAAESSWKKGRPIRIRYSRPLDKRGLNVFETTKEPGADFTGFKLDFGAAFTSQLQNLSHRNTAAPNVVNGVNANQLQDIGFGFNNSTANAVLHAQLAPGVRVAADQLPVRRGTTTRRGSRTATSRSTNRRSTWRR